MPIKFSQEFLSKINQYSELDLQKIQQYRLASLILSAIGLIISVSIYILVTFIGIIHTPEGLHYFRYIFRDDLIYICYYINWIAVFSATICVFIHIYSLMFTIKPVVAKIRENEESPISHIDKLVDEYYSSIKYQLICQVLLIVGIIIEMNYYPRHTELFYPFIGCDVSTGICVITNQVYIPFLFAMTSIIFLLLGVYFLIFLYSLKERAQINLVQNPEIIKQKEEKERMKKKLQMMPLEERRDLKINEIREQHLKKIEERDKKKEDKFEKKWEKEQLGKKGYKEIKKGKVEVVKEKKKERTREDDFDFT